MMEVYVGRRGRNCPLSPSEEKLYFPAAAGHKDEHLFVLLACMS